MLVGGMRDELGDPVTGGFGEMGLGGIRGCGFVCRRIKSGRVRTLVIPVSEPGNDESIGEDAAYQDGRLMMWHANVASLNVTWQLSWQYMYDLL